MEKLKMGEIEREGLRHYIRGLDDDHLNIIMEEISYIRLFDEIYNRLRNDLGFKKDISMMLNLPEEVIDAQDSCSIALLSDFDTLRSKALSLESDNHKLIDLMVAKLTEKDKEAQNL